MNISDVPAVLVKPLLMYSEFPNEFSTARSSNSLQTVMEEICSNYSKHGSCGRIWIDSLLRLDGPETLLFRV